VFFLSFRVQPFGDVPLDCDDAGHMQWLFVTSEKRAKEHGIEGVTLKFTQVINLLQRSYGVELQ